VGDVEARFEGLTTAAKRGSAFSRQLRLSACLDGLVVLNLGVFEEMLLFRSGRVACPIVIENAPPSGGKPIAASGHFPASVRRFGARSQALSGRASECKRDSIGTPNG
jgi:hypothetical protein